jgi:F-type H+-transporting ATPase subunit gamma
VVPELTKDDLILVIGTKGVSYFKNNNYQVDDSFALLLSNFDYEEVIKLRRYLMTKLQNNEIGKIKIAYTYFKNSITFIPRVEDIYPLENKEEKISFKEKSILIEPNPTKVIDNLLPLYIDNMLYSRFVQSLVSEYASRSNAMESATDNASEIIDKLQIDYNKARQQAITQEITEIVSGANAQK